MRSKLLSVCVTVVLFFSIQKVSATGLTISDLTWYYEGEGNKRSSWCLFTVQWDNAWNTAKNHDAAWVFLKFIRPGILARHAFISKDGIKVVTDHTGKNGKYNFKISDDQTGFHVYAGDKYRGKVHLTVRVSIDIAKTGNLPSTTGVTLNAYGVEMVKIPSGSFFVGEPDSSAARRFHAFYNSDAEGKHNGVFELNNEDQEITIGKGSLYYQSTETIYQGDMKGVITKSFPKGVKGFYCMKYELTQGQYADFLNTISPQQNTVRSNIGGSMYYQQRGSIRFEEGRYTADFPNRPCNFISWDDAMAYADWACLRPMTEFEFTKAARGTEKPLPNTFPWGTSSKEKVQRIVNTDGDLVFSNGIDESQLNDNNREIFGASYYWVMDLSGSVWERVITIGDEKGRNFTGLHGDGTISYYGAANVANWPLGNDETGGFGFRGGGFYSHDRSYHEFNPYSPVSYRMYGAWSGGARVESYGSRFVRTE
jgi:formylglycine-generating enzyme required for sulfatase activity